MSLPAAESADARTIARRSKSNLAFALACLPPQRRRDMMAFYAFCRIVDDIADEAGLSVRERRIQLGAWRRIVRGEQSPADPVAREVVRLPHQHQFSVSLFEEIIDGVSMDLEQRRYETIVELEQYCYKVAGVVGLVSLHIFGATDPHAPEYAIALGHALQLTNILRDVHVDWKNGHRLYLPREDLERFGYSEDDLAAGRYNDAFVQLMRFESDRAMAHFAHAVQVFPTRDAHRLTAAEAMRKIYLGILLEMRRDGFRVHDRRYRLHPLKKATILAGAWLRGVRGRFA